jgi:putative transposase
MKSDKTFKWRSCHSIHRLSYHLVFIPKYRRKVLYGRLVQRLSQLIYEAGKMNRWFIHELSINTDHVHMMIQLPSNITIAKAAMYLKGGTSKKIREEFPELEEFLWGDSLWQDGYFAETVGKIDEKTLREYIQRQWEQE